MWADVDRVEILISLLPIIMISSRLTPTRQTLVGELMSISVYTVYLIAYDGNSLTHYMTTVTMIMYKELTPMLSTCHYTCIQQQDYDSS